MSKLLVSDYDGAYKTSEESIKINNAKIEALMQNDEFVFSTGRNYQEFFEEFEKYRLIADYYSLVDGNILLDSKFNIINANVLSKDYINSFKKFYKYFESVELLDAFGDNTLIGVMNIN